MLICKVIRALSKAKTEKFILPSADINKNCLKIVTFLYDNAYIFKNIIWYNAVLLTKCYLFASKLLVACLRPVTRPLLHQNSATFCA